MDRELVAANEALVLAQSETRAAVLAKTKATEHVAAQLDTVVREAKRSQKEVADRALGDAKANFQQEMQTALAEGKATEKAHKQRRIEATAAETAERLNRRNEVQRARGESVIQWQSESKRA